MVCVIVVLATPPTQLWGKVPPPPLAETEISVEVEVRVNDPPVEPDMVTITLVAFTTSKSATEPAATVNVTGGEVIKKFVLEEKTKRAARAVLANKR